MKRYINFSFSLLLAFSCVATNPDVLFVTYDVGDTKPLQKIAEGLPEGTSYMFLPLGKSREIIPKDAHRLDLGISDVPPSNRAMPLPETDIMKVLETINPGVVMSGMSSFAAAQILKAYDELGVPTFAFYDNLGDITQKPGLNQEPYYTTAFLEGIKEAKNITYLLPSTPEMSGFDRHPVTKDKASITVGQPSYKEWEEVRAATDISKLQKDLKLQANQKVVLFTGGRDESYGAHFDLFVGAMAKRPDVQVFVTYHPVTDGSLERYIVQQHKAQNIKVIEKGTYTTPQIAALAQAVFCHKSTCGFQALSAGLPVGFVAEIGYTNPVIDAGISKRVDTEADVLSVLEGMLEGKEQNSLEKLGIPSGAAQTMVDLLLKAAQES